MISVATYNVYVQLDPQSGLPVLIGDVGPGNAIAVDQPGPAIIDVTTASGLTFASPALSWVTAPGEAPPTFVGWGPIDPDLLGRSNGEIAINDANGAAGTVYFQLHFQEVTQPLAASLVNSVA